MQYLCKSIKQDAHNRNMFFFTASCLVVLNAWNYVLVSHIVGEVLAWLPGSKDTTFYIFFLKRYVKKVNTAAPTYDRNILNNTEAQPAVYSRQKTDYQ